jgi:hypothetical protein
VTPLRLDFGAGGTVEAQHDRDAETVLVPCDDGSPGYAFGYWWDADGLTVATSPDASDDEADVADAVRDALLAEWMSAREAEYGWMRGTTRSAAPGPSATDGDRAEYSRDCGRRIP